MWKKTLLAVAGMAAVAVGYLALTGFRGPGHGTCAVISNPFHWRINKAGRGDPSGLFIFCWATAG